MNPPMILSSSLWLSGANVASSAVSFITLGVGSQSQSLSHDSSSGAVLLLVSPLPPISMRVWMGGGGLQQGYPLFSLLFCDISSLHNSIIHHFVWLWLFFCFVSKPNQNISRGQHNGTHSVPPYPHYNNICHTGTLHPPASIRLQKHHLHAKIRIAPLQPTWLQIDACAIWQNHKPIKY